jgi:hypothetical protein
MLTCRYCPGPLERKNSNLTIECYSSTIQNKMEKENINPCSCSIVKFQYLLMLVLLNMCCSRSIMKA